MRNPTRNMKFSSGSRILRRPPQPLPHNHPRRSLKPQVLIKPHHTRVRLPHQKLHLPHLPLPQPLLRRLHHPLSNPDPTHSLVSSDVVEPSAVPVMTYYDAVACAATLR